MSIKVLIAAAVIALTLIGIAAVNSPEASAFIDQGACANSGGGHICTNANQDGSVGTQDLMQRIVNFLLYVAGILAVIFALIGAFKYVTSGGGAGSNGNAGKAASARNTILYAVIGLIATSLAYAIINFVMDSVT